MTARFGPFILFLLFWLQATSTTAQLKPCKAVNLEMSARYDTLHLHFGLKGQGCDKQARPQLYFHDQDLKIYKPANQITDSLMPSANELQISWKINPSSWKTDKQLKPFVVVGQTKDHHFGMGTEAALLSLMLPGLGDYFTGNTAQQHIKPWMRTLGVATLLSAGIYASSQRYRTEPRYFDGRMWSSGKVVNKFFRNDAEILIGAGVALWLGDVIWVAIRGNQNRQLKKNFNTLIIQL